MRLDRELVNRDYKSWKLATDIVQVRRWRPRLIGIYLCSFFTYHNSFEY